MTVQVEGAWPGSVTLCRGWARAESRPWNDITGEARLRVLRGGAVFLEDCVEALTDLGARAVLSPPLPKAAQRIWEQARFVHHARLTVMRRELDTVPAPSHLIVAGSAVDLREALRIDALAFDGFWQFDRLAMIEALRATPCSAIHVARLAGGELAGFAVSGMGAALAYMQRLAVDPAHQGRGIGRSLVRTSARWAKRNGAGALVLNTQIENEAAIRLYLSEGFVEAGTGLDVLRNRAGA